MARRQSSIIKEKPMRGREMKTQIVPKDMMEAMKLVTEKRTLTDANLEPELNKPKEDHYELYHEGYVGSQRYLVPDENLELMKQDVTTKIQIKGFRNLTGEHKDSYPIDDYGRGRRRLENLQDKRIFSTDTETSDTKESTSEDEKKKSKGEETETTEEDEKAEEEEEEESDNGKENDDKKDKDDEEEEPGVESTDDDEKEKGEESPTEKEEEEPEIPEQPGEPERKIVEEPEEPEKLAEETKEPVAQPEEKLFDLPHRAPRDPNRLRLLISGHFMRDQKPIYIIQEYTEDIDLFAEQKADFKSKSKITDSGIEATVTAKFYDRNILEEAEGKPVALDLRPRKIRIDEKKSHVYVEHFERMYSLDSVDLQLAGEFLSSNITQRITPFLSLKKAENTPNVSTSHKVKGGKYDNPTILTCKLEPTLPYPYKF